MASPRGAREGGVRYPRHGGGCVEWSHRQRPSPAGAIVLGLLGGAASSPPPSAPASSGCASATASRVDRLRDVPTGAAHLASILRAP